MSQDAALTRKPLTGHQARVMAFMRSYFAENDQLPPPEALRDHFGWKSENSVTEIRKTLERKGWIERNAAGKHRFTRQTEVSHGSQE